MRCFYDGLHPCGKCPACLANRQRAFMFRLDEEKDQSKFYFWLTLTYDDDHVPRFDDGEMCFSKSHCRNFFEKLRKRYEKKGNKFKHFLVSEYGPESTHRPHYHCLLMVYNEFKPEVNYLVRKEMRDFIINKAWDYGHVTEKAYHGRVLRYLTKYCNKPELLGEHHSMKPFTLISRGIGLSFLDRLPDDHKKQMIDKLDFTYRYNGGKIQLPRYIVDKILPHSAEDLRKAMPNDPAGDWSEYDRIKSIRDRLQQKQNILNLRAHHDLMQIDSYEGLLDYAKEKNDTNNYQMSIFRSKLKKRKNL